MKEFHLKKIKRKDFKTFIAFSNGESTSPLHLIEKNTYVFHELHLMYIE